MNIIEAFEAVKKGKNVKHSSWMHDLGHVRLINGYLVSEYDEKPLRITLTEENLIGWELIEKDLKIVVEEKNYLNKED